jgi:hypothetical protein
MFQNFHVPNLPHSHSEVLIDFLEFVYEGKHFCLIFLSEKYSNRMETMATHYRKFLFTISSEKLFGKIYFGSSTYENFPKYCGEKYSFSK